MAMTRIGAGGLQEVGAQPRGDRDARLVLLVRADVGEIRGDRGDARRRGEAQGVEHDEELDDAVGDRRTRRLDDEDVGAAHVLLDLDLHVLVLEADRAGAAEGTLRWAQMARASAGWAEPVKTLSGVWLSKRAGC
jgi:hypothetical protein